MSMRSGFGSGSQSGNFGCSQPHGPSEHGPSEVAHAAMKWGADGELSAIDLQSILLRLGAVDEQAASLMDCPLDPTH
jgi:hypothetical protein